MLNPHVCSTPLHAADAPGGPRMPVAKKEKEKERGKTHLLVAHATQHGLIIRLPFGQRNGCCTAGQCILFQVTVIFASSRAATGRRLPRMRRVARAADPQPRGIQPGLCIRWTSPLSFVLSCIWTASSLEDAPCTASGRTLVSRGSRCGGGGKALALALAGGTGSGGGDGRCADRKPGGGRSAETAC